MTKEDARRNWDKASMALSNWARTNGHHTAWRENLEAVAPAELLKADNEALATLRKVDPRWR